MYCQCGCGELAPIAKKTRGKLGHVKGQPVRYICGHHRRMWNRYIIDSNGCWIWQGYIHPNTGYGEWYYGGEKLAHRAFYTRNVGPIPEGLDLDHLCSTRACVNPEHLEPVTRGENNRRTFQRGRNNRPRNQDGTYAPSG
jgi:hypothetical protein